MRMLLALNNGRPALTSLNHLRKLQKSSLSQDLFTFVLRSQLLARAPAAPTPTSFLGFGIGACFVDALGFVTGNRECFSQAHTTQPLRIQLLMKPEIAPLKQGIGWSIKVENLSFLYFIMEDNALNISLILVPASLVRLHHSLVANAIFKKIIPFVPKKGELCKEVLGL